MTTQQQETETQHTPQFGEAGFTPAAHADDAELAALEAAATEEAKGASPAATQDAEAETEQHPEQTEQETEAEAVEPDQGAAAQAKGSPMIPKSRLDQALRERDEMRERLARLEGMVVGIASGRQAPAQGEQQPEAPQTPEQRIEALKGDLDKLAERYEAGEISTREWSKQQIALNEAIFDIKTEMREPRAANSDTYLQEQTSRLEDDFPVLKEITADDVEAIVPLARREAAKQGIDITTDLKLRRHIASFAQSYYGKTQAPGGKPQGQGQPANQNPAANAAAKLNLARNAPPNLNTHAVAYAGAANGEPSVTDFMSMNDDQIAAPPPAVVASLEKKAAAAR